MTRTDLHLHSSVSPDSEALMTDTVAAAIDKGIDILCFTDHCDLIRYDQPYVRKEESYGEWQLAIRELEQVRTRYGDQIELLLGMELGEMIQVPEQAAVCAATPGLDFIIGSVHALVGHKDFYFLQYTDQQQCEALTRQYLEENTQMARMDLADVIGHIGYTNRYMNRQGFNVDLMAFTDQLRPLFRILVENGKGIEVNTSGLRQGSGCTFPPVPVLKLYRECGGEVITIGSDAHLSPDVGADIDTAQALLREAGFRYMTVFRQRKPDMIKL